MSGKLPVTILSGFLGAGKTTMLRSLLDQDLQSTFAVIVNEFGMVSVDGATLRLRQRAGVEIFELSKVLIAYASDEHLLPTLNAIALRQYKIDHVLIETSGLAVPTALIEVFERPQYKRDFVIDALLTVVDTPNFLSSADSMIDSERETFVEQLNSADVVVLNKIDRLGEGEIVAAASAVRQLAPSVRFIELAHNAKLDRNVALGLRLNQPARWLEFGAPAVAAMMGGGAKGHHLGDGHSHSGLAAHEHGLLTHEHVHNHDPAWISFVLYSNQTQDFDSFASALQEITNKEPVLRLKGTVIFPERTGALSVQGVRTRIVIGEPNSDERNNHNNDEHYRLHGHSHSYTHDHKHHNRSELVFIGHNLDRATVADSLSRRTNTLWS